MRGYAVREPGPGRLNADARIHGSVGSDGSDGNFQERTWSLDRRLQLFDGPELQSPRGFPALWRKWSLFLAFESPLSRFRPFRRYFSQSLG